MARLRLQTVFRDHPAFCLLSSFMAFVVLCGVSTPRQTAAAKNTLISWSGHLERLRKVADEIGIQVVRLPRGQVVWEYQPQIPLVLASLAKVLTSYAALEHLGASHTFRTGIWALQAPRGGVISGNVWIRGEGDPYLLTEKAWLLALKLKALGVERISGGVLVDNSFFSPPVERLCIDGRCERPHNPVITPTAFNFNTLQFQVYPGAAAGSPVYVTWFPPGSYVAVENRAQTVASNGKLSVGLVSLGVKEGGREAFRLTGTVPVGIQNPLEYRVNVADPEAFTAQSFRELLRQCGITVTGSEAGAGRVPSGAKLLTFHHSPPLGDLLFGLNRYSNNFMAEVLLRDLGATRSGDSSSSLTAGLQVLRESLLRLGLHPEEFQLDSGSGLSRTSRASARTFCKVLEAVYMDFTAAPEFVSSLAQNGHDGTLRRRLRTDALLVRGKTGTLSQVITFSGYVSDSHGKVYAVTVLLNGVKNNWEGRRALDAFVRDVPRLAG